MFIERTGMKSPWAEKTKTDLARVRALLLEQPAGEGGLPPGAKPKPDAAAPGGNTLPPSAASAKAVAAEPDGEGPPKEPTLRLRGSVQAPE
jgi:hypothetical protein